MDLILKFSGWVLEQDPEQGLRIFMEDVQASVEKVYLFATGLNSFENCLPSSTGSGAIATTKGARLFAPMSQKLGNYVLGVRSSSLGGHESVISRRADSSVQGKMFGVVES